MFDLCIIGFGISGISTARWAHKENLNFVVLEKNENLGGCWYSKSYPNVILQTDKTSYCYSDMPHEDNIQKFPSRSEILSYLHKYCKKFKLYEYVKFNSQVIKTTKDNDKWKINYSKEGNEYVIYSKYLCICSGFYNDKIIPKIKGIQNYQGNIKHSQDWSYTGSETIHTFKNKNVLVIGNGPSGCDLASLAVRHNAKNVTLLYRSDRWIFERYNPFFSNFNLINRAFLWFGNYVKKSISLKLLHFINILYFILTWITYKQFNKSIIGFPKNIINRNNITLNEDIYRYIFENKLNYVNGEIINFTNNHVEIKKYKSKHNKYYSMKPNLIIMATGYNKKIKFFDLQKTPHLYKGILYPKDITCGFVGFVTTLSWIQTSDLQARWFIKYIIGKINKPNSKEINEYLIREKKHFKERNNPDYHDFGYRSYIYCDKLAKEIKAEKKTKKYNIIPYWLKTYTHDEWAY